MSTTRTRAARAPSLVTTPHENGRASDVPTDGERLRGVPVLVLALLLAGCGSADTAAPSTAASSTSTAPTSSPSATSTPSPPASAADAAWSASGPSFGVDRAEWPGTIEDARALLKSLPKELAGETRELYVGPGDEGGAGASYGKVGDVQVDEEGQGDIDPVVGQLRAYQLLQASFGLGAICANNTDKGTIPMPVPSYVEEGLPKPAAGVVNGSGPGWFSCQPLEDDQWGHAVGWTSKKTAWLVYARDEKAARTLVTALHSAAR